MRTDSALSASARSSWRLTIWLTFTPGAGWNSNTVITGPGPMPSIVPSTPNSSQRNRMASPRRTSSSSSIAGFSFSSCRRLSGGSSASARVSTKPNSFCFSRRTGASAGSGGSAWAPPPLCDEAPGAVTLRTVSGRSAGRSVVRSGRRNGRSSSPPAGGRARSPEGGSVAGRLPGETPASLSRRSCFSSATLCRCFTTTRLRERSFSLRSLRRARARRHRSSAPARRRRQRAIASPRLVCTSSATPTMKSASRSTSAPAKFIRCASAVARTTPSAPPESIVPLRQSREGRSSWSSAGKLTSMSAAPAPRPTTFGRALGLSLRQAATARSSGMRRQVRPRRPKPAAAISAPKPPIQL